MFVFRCHTVQRGGKNIKILGGFAENLSFSDTKPELCFQFFFLLQSYWSSSLHFSIHIFPIFCPVPALFLPSFHAIEVLSSCPAFDNLLSFIHDILITKSVINTLPDQCFPSIMADRCGLMWHKELDELLRANSGAASAKESNSKEDWWTIPRWRSRFQRIIKQLVLFVTVTTHLSSVNC